MMAEYIKRDDAMSHPFANGKYDCKNANYDFILGHESYKEWLETLPAADVVEVVRCKDCKYYKPDQDEILLCQNPELPLFDPSQEFFCAFGEMWKKDD